MASVVYQVFVDRFRRAAVTNDTGAPTLPPSTPVDERRAWHLPPEEPPLGRDFYGGDLDGVADALPHLVALGADAVYLTPIFSAPSNHKYDTSDFDTVDPGFGGDAAFERLAARARSLDLGVILDGVFNHVGERHRWARDPRFVSGAPWRGYGHLRELSLSAPEVREALFGEEGVIARWTRRGATGWRLDCANDLGPTACALAAEAARRASARDGTIGEIMAYPAAWAGPGRLDGVMNYWLRSAALRLGRAEAGDGSAPMVQEALDRLAREMPADALQRSWSVVASHDTPRLGTALGGDEAAVRLALMLQFIYPGVPLIYYGEEIGMVGGEDPQNRSGMRWDERDWDHNRAALYRRLCALRRSEPALARGRYVAMPQPGTDMVAFARETARASETLIFVASAAAAPTRARLFLPLGHLYDAVPLRDLFTGWEGRMQSGCLDVELPARGALCLRPADDHPSGYRFFKHESVLESLPE
jgi:alpha-glucosidase